jgi:hypothetical protein
VAHRNVRARNLSLSLAALACGAAAPVPADAQPSAAPGRCAAPEHRQFDFWLGEWEVRTPDGKLAGRNTIRRTLGGCVLQENWRGARGHQGTSYNIYDASRRRWHQTWVDDEGLLLQLDGSFADGRMVLSGETVDSAGRPMKQRITWEPLQGGKVRQRWDSSPDGIAWRLEFEGIYSRSRSPS